MPSLGDKGDTMLTSRSGGAAGVEVRPRRMLYSRGQIALAVFLAGPLPALHMLISNLRALGRTELLPLVVVAGYALMMAEMVAVWFVPRHSVMAAMIPAINLGLVSTTLLPYQPEKTVFSENRDYLPAPAWRVAWTCVIRFLEFVAWFAGVVAVFDILGIQMTK